MKFRAYHKKYGMSEPFYLTSDEVDFPAPLDDGMACIVKMGSEEGKRILKESKVMRFSERTNKKGIEIFEGDILKEDVGDILEVKFGELPLDKSGDCVCKYNAFYCKNYGQLGQAPYYECKDIGEWMEVIGNIYQNRVLIK